MRRMQRYVDEDVRLAETRTRHKHCEELRGWYERYLAGLAGKDGGQASSEGRETPHQPGWKKAPARKEEDSEEAIIQASTDLVSDEAEDDRFDKDGFVVSPPAGKVFTKILGEASELQKASTSKQGKGKGTGKAAAVLDHFKGPVEHLQVVDQENGVYFPVPQSPAVRSPGPYSDSPEVFGRYRKCSSGHWKEVTPEPEPSKTPEEEPEPDESGAYDEIHLTPPSSPVEAPASPFIPQLKEGKKWESWERGDSFDRRESERSEDQRDRRQPQGERRELLFDHSTELAKRKAEQEQAQRYPSKGGLKPLTGGPSKPSLKGIKTRPVRLAGQDRWGVWKMLGGRLQEWAKI
jgi:hypothetical protein